MEHLLYIGASLIRITAAFSLTPLFGRTLMPALVRNSIFIGFAIVVLTLQPPPELVKPTSPQWATLFLRELFIGLAMGFLLGSALWTFDMAGSILDLKIGATSTQVSSPFTGNQTTLHGAMISQIGIYIFFMSGGISIFLSIILKSYIIWPLFISHRSFNMIDSRIFEQYFGRIFSLSLAISAPIVIAMSFVDFAMGLINRFSPQLNIFSISLAIKSWISNFLILIFITLIANTIVIEITGQEQKTLNAIRHTTNF